MEQYTKARYLTQMLANLEQLDQSCRDLDLEIDFKKQKTYIMQEYKRVLSAIEDKKDE